MENQTMAEWKEVKRVECPNGIAVCVTRLDRGSNEPHYSIRVVQFLGGRDKTFIRPSISWDSNCKPIVSAKEEEVSRAYSEAVAFIASDIAAWQYEVSEAIRVKREAKESKKVRHGQNVERRREEDRARTAASKSRSKGK